MYLNDLKELEIVECLNEDSKKGRLYSASKFGKHVAEMIHNGVKNE